MSIGILLLWIGIVVVVGHVVTGEKLSIVQFVSQGIAWPIVGAVVLLIVALALFRWPDVGFDRFPVIQAVRLMWLPIVYLCGFAGVLVALGLPPAASVLFVVVNTVLVGFSEEVMFRGIVFSGLRTRFGIWPSVWISCAVFGLIHLLNAVHTGQFAAAALQAVAAFMTGTMLLAVRLRTGSLYPVIVLHAAWDCLPLLIATQVGSLNADQPPSGLMYLAPLLVLPNFLYALYLLRPKGLAKAAALGEVAPALSAA